METLLPVLDRASDHVVQEIKRTYPMNSRQVATELIGRLGVSLATAIGGSTDARRAHAWARGEKPQREIALKHALQATVAIAARFDDEAARAWFASSNIDLGMKSPTTFIRDANTETDYIRLVSVAIQDAS
jgi:hypothetical protein